MAYYIFLTDDLRLRSAVIQKPFQTKSATPIILIACVGGVHVAFTTANPCLGTDLLEVSIEREVGALKGLTPSLLETPVGAQI